MCVQPVCTDIPSITVDPGFGCVISAVSEFQALLDDVCQGGFVNISEKGKQKRNHVALIRISTISNASVRRLVNKVLCVHHILMLSSVI